MASDPELLPGRDERGHYVPTKFERWALRGLISLLVMLVSWIGLRAIDGQDKTVDAVRDLTTQVAVMRNQISDLTLQVGDTHDMTKQIAVMQQMQQDHERRIELLEDQRSRPHQ